MGLAALAAAGAGAAMLMKKTKEINEEETFHVKETTENYRNTERGKYDKNSNKEQLIRYKQVSHLRKVDVICQIKKDSWDLQHLRQPEPAQPC